MSAKQCVAVKPAVGLDKHHGNVVLIREYIRKKRRINKPTAALLKATLIAGATRLKGYAPNGAIVDHHQGYGRVNIDAVLLPTKPASADFVEVKPGLRTGEVWGREVKIQSGDVPFRIVLAYSDFPGTSLVNNLNMIIYSPDERRFVGNQPEGGGMTLDTNNNVEVVHIPKPTAGIWRIEVVGSNIPQGPQDFAIVLVGHLG